MNDPDDSAIQLVYLVAGIEPELQRNQTAMRLNPDTPVHMMTEGLGHIGMVADLVPYAKDVAAYIDSMAGKQDFSGVFEYEVTEPLGTWVAQYPGGQWPTRDAFKAELERLGTAFFAQ